MAAMVVRLVKEKGVTVAEAMSEVVCIVDCDQSVAEAVATLADMNVTGAPVVDGERIVGVVSRSDLLKAPDRAAEVTAVMTKVVYAVRPSDPLLLAVRLMTEQAIHRVIVINDEGELAGVLSAMDVLRVMVDEAGPHELGYVDLRTTELSASRGE